MLKVKMTKKIEDDATEKETEARTHTWLSIRFFTASLFVSCLAKLPRHMHWSITAASTRICCHIQRVKSCSERGWQAFQGGLYG